MLKSYKMLLLGVKMLKTDFMSVWKAKKGENTYINFHSHNYYELVYYCNGNGETVIADKKFEFQKNSFTIIPPGVIHNEFHRNDCVVICLSFSVNINNFNIFDNDDTLKVYRILEEILKETANQDYLFETMTNTKLKELCIFLTRKTAKKTSSEKNFEYVINYLNENFHEKIILTDCAKQLNISYDYFQHKFKETTGRSPKQFLIDCRLAAAEKLLIQSNSNCTEIAYRCGFSTSAQFSKLFRNRYKISPLKYRRRETLVCSHCGERI